MHELVSPSDQGAQQLCQACGLCCKGVWFSHVSLEQDEVESARRVGFELQMRDATPGFSQPCVMHKDSGCSIYDDWRPNACIKYSCALRDVYLAGRSSLEAALTQVQAARGMADRIQAETGSLPGGLRGKEFISRLQGPSVDGVVAQPVLSPESRMDAVALRVYFDRFFKNPDSPVEVSGVDSPASPAL